MARAKQVRPRADFGAPVTSFFAKQTPEFKKILVELRKLIEAAAPGVESQLKWGMPHYTLDGKMFAATSAHKAHINLIMFGGAKSFVDPKGLLEGEGKVGRHLKIRALAEIPRADIKRWLATSAKQVRALSPKPPRGSRPHTVATPTTSTTYFQGPGGSA